MKRKVAIFLSLIFVGILIFMIFPKTGFVTQSISGTYLENLREKAGVECLQNSQCPNNTECIDNVCINKKEVNLCKSISLSSPTRQIKVGDSTNSIKEILTKTDLFSLLSGGELVEIISGKTIEYFYSSSIILGDNNIEQDNNGVLTIQNNEPLYTYKLIFSTGVDFSNKNIQGQALKILGNEYIIGPNSKNSAIELIFDKKTITLQEKNNIKITIDKTGNVIMIEISISSQDKIKNGESNTDSIFNFSKLSFNSADNNFANIEVGGNC